jgi:hypothetical protein
MEVLVSKGFLIYAEGVDYIQQAYALALSIKYSQPTINNVSLLTQDPVPEKYQKVFDQIIPIPWYEKPGGKYSAEHRWKVYHATPYDETIVLDADMLVLEDIAQWWDYCSDYNVKFCNRIQNYKLETVVDTVNRRAFIANDLSSPYYALHYFKKSDEALEFYRTLEFVCNNWEWCWTKFAPKEYQKWLSMDLATAISIEILLAHEQVFDHNSPLEFIHMKPSIQNWHPIPDTWQDTVTHVLNSRGDLIVGNILQSKIFHYVESNFITDKLLTRLEELAHG